MSQKTNAAMADKSVDQAKKPQDVDTLLVQQLDIEEKVQEDLHKNLDATQLYLV